MKKPILMILFLTLPCLQAWSAKQNKPASQTEIQKIIRALRTGQPIEIDGRLTETVWQSEGNGDFIMSNPIDGGSPSEKTRVWVAYDDANLYVAAYCYDSDPKGIRGYLGRRDDDLDSDFFIFAVDPYYDRRTGYLFAVTPAGSIQDMTLRNDVGEDRTWDGVWDWKTQVNGDGWVVEMRIPFNQLRFPKKNEYVWGVDFRRTIKRKEEKVGLIWVPKDQVAYVSRFARLEGIANICPKRQIEVLSYTLGQAEFKPAEAGNPFETGHHYSGKLGFDFKIGLKSNVILDATVNPDFGQVEVDPAVINLSAYETYYQEKRPFFIEGASLFNDFGRGGVFMNANINWPSPTFFYSRRIGRSPQGSVEQDGSVWMPAQSAILGAFKLTGQFKKGWNVGFLSGLTSREYAKIDHLGLRSREEVEPFSYYGVFRVQKDIQKGRSGFGVIATSVIRDLRETNLRDILNKKAFSLAFDGWTSLDKKNSWVLGGWIGGTRVEGSREDIFELQQSSMHYYQRPDATHVKLNPEATSLSGWGGRFSLVKQQGKFLFLSSFGVLSPGFDPNDIGFQYSNSDRINFHLLPAYQITKPGKIFRNLFIIAGPFWNYDFGRNKTWQGVMASIEGEFSNYWYFNVMAAYNPRTFDNSLTRGGPLVAMPAGHELELQLHSDSRKSIVLEWHGYLYRRPSEGRQYHTCLSLRWKPRPNFNLSFGPEFTVYRSELMWVTNVEDPFMTETFGSRYVFGRIDQKTLSGEIRLNWIFTPKLSLQLYFQPFISVGKYDKFKELSRSKTCAYRVFGTDHSTIVLQNDEYTIDPDGSGPAQPFSFTNPDFNSKSLRGTVVLRWEYSPGSQIFFVWTQSRADEAHPGGFRFGRDLGDLFRAPGENVFLIKFSYRWNF